MPTEDRVVVYGGTENHKFDASVLELVNGAMGLGLTFDHIWHETWPDGEPGFALDNHTHIQGRHAIIFSCPVTCELEGELRDLVAACKHQYRAGSVTVVLSFLRYRRQDREERMEEITRLRWFIKDLKGWGADRLVVCEPHSVKHTRKHCDDFGLEFHTCDPTGLFADEIGPLVQTLGTESVKIYSPDFGSAGRAIALARATGTTVVATPKQRLSGVTVAVGQDFDRDAFQKRIHDEYGANVPVSCDVTDFSGLHMFMREDELSTGTTAILTADMLRQSGAESVRMIATHPVCARGWKMRFFPRTGGAPFDGVWLGNTRPRGINHTAYKGSTGGRVRTVDVTPAVAETLVEVLQRIAVDQ